MTNFRTKNILCNQKSNLVPNIVFSICINNIDQWLGLFVNLVTKPYTEASKTVIGYWN